MLLLTEASTQKRASLHLVRGEDGLAALDPSGIEPLEASVGEFRGALLRESHTLKRALTDPCIFSGIGNAHCDEILHRADRLAATEIERLYTTARSSLREWTERLLAETGDAFPENVTAFHPALAVHGRYGKPCPACGAAVQRIVYGERERDRALSRLLREDWPATVDELEGR